QPLSPAGRGEKKPPQRQPLSPLGRGEKKPPHPQPLSPAGRGERQSPRRKRLMALEPLSIGVCSWSLQVTSIPELRRLLDGLGINVVQIACGDPHHADWQEGDRLPEAARAAGFTLTGAMLGFPGEDYTTPQTIQKSGGFGNPATRAERLERFAWALDRTLALGV